MFGFFKKKPIDPPTEKQLKYAARLRIHNAGTMSKSDLSFAIAAAERNNPELPKKREAIKSKVREKKFGAELVALEKKWDDFAQDVEFMLAVYIKGNETIVDVLQVNEAYITEKGVLKLSVAEPKLIKDKVLGQLLEWDKTFDIPVDSIAYSEALAKDFYDSDINGYENANRRYNQIIEKGLQIARKLK